MCNIWKGGDTTPDLTLKEIERFSKSKRLKRIMFLGISGGEPFLRKDLVKAVTIMANNMPLLQEVRFSTNGSLTGKIESDIKELLKNVKCGIDVTISLDGIGDAHDRVRGRDGFYKSALETINALKKIRESDQRLSIGIRHTMLPDNYKQIPDLYRLARELDISFTTKPATSGGLYDNAELFSSAEISSWENEFTPKQKIEAIETIKKLYDSEYRRFFKTGKGSVKNIASLLFLKYSINYIRNPKKTVFPCYACFSSVFIEHDGTVYSCVVLYRKIGSIREESFDRIWSGKKMKETRQFIKKGTCPCYTNCNQIPSLVLSKSPEILKMMAKKKMGFGKDRD
jgi:MoaA/NifB/PqqE/SkfB family radical SAM enzyme